MTTDNNRHNGLDAGQCPGTNCIEDYVACRLDPAEAGQMADHISRCTCCRGKAASLRLMETSADGKTRWRLPHVRHMLQLDSPLSAAAAERIRCLLASISRTPADSESLAIDTRGRLLIQVDTGLKPDARAQATGLLSWAGCELELFSTPLSEPRLEAIVDFSCCTEGAVTLDSSALSVILAQPGHRKRICRAAMPRATGFDELNLAAVDRLLASEVDPHTTLCPPDQAALLLGRFLRAWTVGNDGETHEQAWDRYLELVPEVKASEQKPIDFTTSFVGSMPEDTLKRIERKRTDEV